MQTTRQREKDRKKEQGELMQLVGFVTGKEHFGVDILMVQEIIRMAPITSVPNAPGFIEGVINLRGRIIPIIDLRRRLGLSGGKMAGAESTRILIVNVDERVTGFIVDSVTKVMKIEVSDIEPPPDIVVAGLKSKYIRGVCEIDGRLLILLDFSRILQVREAEELESFQDRKERTQPQRAHALVNG